MSSTAAAAVGNGSRKDNTGRCYRLQSVVSSSGTLCTYTFVPYELLLLPPIDGVLPAQAIAMQAGRGKKAHSERGVLLLIEKPLSLGILT